MIMDIFVVRASPLIRKNMNFMPGIGKLMDISISKLLSATIKNKFLSNNGNFHCSSDKSF